MNISNMIHAIDLHACGEPGRVIVGGVLDVPGETMFEKMQYFEQKADSLRLRMLREPRGYPAANCNLILPSNNPEAAAGFIIMEQTEYPGMSGTNTICVVTTLIETGMVEVNEPFTEFKLETPAGLISIKAEVKNGKTINVTFENVPAFSVYSNESIYVPEIGEVKVDVAYGGMFYVILDSEELGLKLTPDNGGKIVRIAEMVKAIASEKLPVVHPENKDISGITIAVVSGPPENPDATLKNAVVVSTGKLDWNRQETWKGVIDRSPCGTGTSARMAQMYFKGKLKLNDKFIHESYIGSKFIGTIKEESIMGSQKTIIPKIKGWARIYGYNKIIIDKDDPYAYGFQVI